MGQTVFNNIAGTLRSTFRLGKVGPSFRQGTLDPNASSVQGVDGDVYIQYGDDQKLFQRRNNLWMPLLAEGQRTLVTANSYSLTSNDVYVGVNNPHQTTNLYLPNGTQGAKYTIKDESGLVGTDDSTKIIVNPNSIQTIDGNSSRELKAPYASLTVLFGSEWHIV